MVGAGIKSSVVRGLVGDGIRRDDFERLYPKLISRFRSLGASLEEARDLTQETFIRAHKSLSSFEGRSQLDTWVISIAKRVWLKDRRSKRTLKRQGNEVSLDATPMAMEVPAPAPDAQAQAVTKELLGKVARSIRAFPETMREAVVMFFNGHKYCEIAERLGVSENHVASLIHQARSKLRKEHLS